MIKTARAMGMAVMLAAGCGGSDGPGSCSVSSGGAVVQCVDYTGVTSDQVSQNCTALRGTYATSACSSSNRVGRCTISSTAGGISLTQTLSYYPPTTVSSVMSICSQVTGTGVTATFMAN
jgi:hypothetical protein